jgi:hypothetical protein
MKSRRAADLSTGMWKNLDRRLRNPAALTVAAAVMAALLGVAPAQHAFAQDDSGGSIYVGGDITATVEDAVSNITTGGSSGGTVSGGDSFEHSEASFGDDEGLAIADASGGNRNQAANKKR